MSESGRSTSRSGSGSTATCPVSAGKGQPVPRETLEHLLTNPAGLGAGPFFFCSDPGCAVVYFDAPGSEVYRKHEVAVRVGLKETEDPIPVCYCFGFSRAMLREEIEATGETTIPRQIKTRIAAGECECEIRNPQATCCLGNVNATVRAIEKERNPQA